MARDQERVVLSDLDVNENFSENDTRSVVVFYERGLVYM